MKNNSLFLLGLMFFGLQIFAHPLKGEISDDKAVSESNDPVKSDHRGYFNENLTVFSPTIYSLGYFENFANFVPMDWAVFSEGTPAEGPSNEGALTWIGKAFANDSSSPQGQAARLTNAVAAGVNLQDWLISPRINLSGPAELSFLTALTTHNTSVDANNSFENDDRLEILITTDGGVTWENLEIFNKNEYPMSIGQTYTIDLEAYSGVVQIAFWVTNSATIDNGPLDLFIDDFSVALKENESICAAPSAITFSNTATNSTDVSWTENGTATEWEVIYGETGFDPVTEGTTLTVNDDPETSITGLDADTQYDVYVRSNCSMYSSDFAGPESFTTDMEPCLEVSNISFNNTTTDSTDVSWTENGTATQWEVIYGETGFDPLTQGTTETVNGSPETTIDGLDADTQYDVYVRAICSENNESELTGPASFTTEMMPCLEVSNISFSNTSKNSTNVSWIENGTATEWDVIYGERNFDPETGGITIIVNGNPETIIDGLDDDMDYDVYVRAICSEDSESDLTGPAMFTTAVASTSGFDFESFVYYPNPVQNVLNLDAQAQIDRVVIHNMLGQKIMDRNSNQTQLKLNLADFASGVYFMNVTIDGVQKTFKIVKE